MRKILLTEADKFIYNKQIRPYLPEHIFDVHSHILMSRFCKNVEKTLTEDPLLGEVDYDFIKQWWKALFPDSVVNGLVMGFPIKNCEIEEQNNYVASEVKNTNDYFGILTVPRISQNELERMVLNLKPSGLKPYMCFAENTDTLSPLTQNAVITDFIPEEQLVVANKYKLAVTLHVSRPRGMADKNNLETLTRLVKDYPNCQFILAHCGRCFIRSNMTDTLKYLPEADNLWFDTSAVCDLGVFIELFSKYDWRKILFGTDLVTATGFRGSYVGLGTGWAECIGEEVNLKEKATFVAYENLSSLLYAMNLCGLKKEQIEAVFNDNAKALFSRIGDFNSK